MLITRSLLPLFRSSSFALKVIIIVSSVELNIQGKKKKLFADESPGDSQLPTLYDLWPAYQFTLMRKSWPNDSFSLSIIL